MEGACVNESEICVFMYSNCRRLHNFLCFHPPTFSGRFENLSIFLYVWIKHKGIITMAKIIRIYSGSTEVKFSTDFDHFDDGRLFLFRDR